jgi:hypothetical protein
MFFMVVRSRVLSFLLSLSFAAASLIFKGGNGGIPDI